MTKKDQHLPPKASRKSYTLIEGLKENPASRNRKTVHRQVSTNLKAGNRDPGECGWW